MSAPYANVGRGLAVLKEARRAGQDSATWPRLSPGEARNIITALDDAAELYEALEELLRERGGEQMSNDYYRTPAELSAIAALARARGEEVAK